MSEGQPLRWRRVRFMARDPDDVSSPGVQLKIYEDIADLPRPGDLVMVDGRKFLVSKGGVLWNFGHESLLVTISVEYISDEG